MDDIAVGDIKAFEEQFLDHLRREKSGLLSAIRETKKFDDDTQAGVLEAINGFKQQFLGVGKENVPVGHEAEPGALPEAEVEQVKIVKQKR
jgi:F-type H+-transporting ATPase subunit alpha